jgi:hypothetical protein
MGKTLVALSMVSIIGDRLLYIDLPCRIDRVKDFPYDKDIPYFA